MEKWLKLSLFLCTFGILREFRPSEPFVTKYLNNPPMNFTLTTIDQEIYPIGTYSSMALLIVIFLSTDILRYKPILILNGLTGIICYIMLIECRSLFQMQIMEVLYGLFTACDVAYCTYIYSKVDKSHYQEVTSHTHGAYLVGRAISGITSQVLISSRFFSYYDLNFFTLAGMVLATAWCFLLPSVQQSVYFHRPPEDESTHSVRSDDEVLFVQYVRNGFKFMVKDFITAFTSAYVLKWIFWWALATCGYNQILSYIQVLWEVIAIENNEKKDTDWNGGVEALYTILSAIATLVCGKVQLDWKRVGEFILSICSIFIGGILLVASQTSVVYIAYVADVLAKIIYHAMITIANSEVAKNINPDSYALIFGMTNFIALVLQSLLTFVVKTVFKLPVRTQFVVYSVYFFVLGVFFAIIKILYFIKKGKKPYTSEEPLQNINLV